MKQSLKELILGLNAPLDNGAQFLRDTSQFIEEARKGGDWTEWNLDIYERYFEKAMNGVAYLGQGVLRGAERENIKKHWKELAPHLKAIAESQNKPLWEEYNQVRTIIKALTNKSVNVATNRLLAGIQPKLLCTECDITRINELIDYIDIACDVQVPTYDRTKWEEASYALLQFLRAVCPEKTATDFSYVPWRLLDYFRKEREECKIPKYWIVSSNYNRFDITKCIDFKGNVDWNKNADYKVGDYIFMFETKPTNRILYKMKVVKTGISYEDSDDESAFDKQDESGDNHDKTFCKFEKIEDAPTTGLTFGELKKHGLNPNYTSIRNYVSLKGELLSYILSVFNHESNDFVEITNPDEVYEGAKKVVVVNSYERNQGARDICIAHHGCKCCVCEIDFEETYGKLGRGFIHVHHKVPLSQIGKEYKLDPVNDLVPVCPNCHAMLHRGVNGRVFTVEELRELIQIQGRLSD